MKELTVCFIGIGSIARRHIRNLRKICKETNIELNIDAVRRNPPADAEKVELGLRNVYTDIQHSGAFYDAIFITNPTEYHLTALQSSVNHSNHFFVEKPVVSVSQMDKVTIDTYNPDALYYVACPLRYNAVIQYIKENVDLSQVVSVRSISSSYLPDWRPGIDYRNTYSAKKALGGGVSIDLVHEWDYLTYLFGKPEKIQCMIGKKSNLEIDSDDYAIYLAEYSDKIVELHLDYFGRKTIREIMLITKEDTIVGDIVNQQIVFLNSGKTISFCEDRDDYQIRELRFFLGLLNGKEPEESNIQHAINVLKLTQGIV